MENKKRGHVKQLMKIDWQSIRNKAKAHASVSEICVFFGISRTTLYERCIKDNGITLPEFMEESKDLGKLMLKEAMFKTAIEGNVSQQIYLSKNWLGYKDKHDVTTNEESINKPVIQVINEEMAKDVNDFIEFVSKKKEYEAD